MVVYAASSAATNGDGSAQGSAASSGIKPDSNSANAPLTQADINLYLTVMRAAAERVHHPTAADLAAIQRAKTDEAAQNKAAAANKPVMAKINAAMQASQAAFQHGDPDAARAAQATVGKEMALVQTPTIDEHADDLAQAFRSGQVDELIVKERHINEDLYDGIVDRIEAAMPSPYAAFGDGGGGDVMTSEQRKAAAEYEAALARWRRELAPYRSEIEALEKVVRKPHYDH